ncbi:MAG TPA: hypothetical protein VK113_04645 [Gemmatimonadales bacterium]|nr:hypothetical protein [Gemmatimonadales bacterium]
MILGLRTESPIHDVGEGIRVATVADPFGNLGELVGWIKGGVVGVVGMLLLGVIGWIPTLAVIGVGGFVVYKLFSGPKKSE